MSSFRQHRNRAISASNRQSSNEPVGSPRSKKWTISTFALSLIVALLLVWKFVLGPAIPIVSYQVNSTSVTPLAPVGNASVISDLQQNEIDSRPQGMHTDQTREGEEVPEASSWKAREETSLELDLSHGGDTFEEKLIVVSASSALLTNGVIKSAKELKVGDYVSMTGDNVGLVKGATTSWYVPPPQQQADTNGNIASRVVGTTKRMTNRILHLYTDNETIETTPEHPFSIAGKGWVPAGQLQHGDRIKTEDGQTVSVQSLEVKAERRMVYNLRVEGTENYFVGKNRLLVHNGGDCVPGINLNDLMKNSGLTPTQKEVYVGNINEYAEKMKNGTWDWNRTATNPRELMIKDAKGNIMAGHHRFIAAEKAGKTIPNGVVKVIPGSGARVPRSWSDVKVNPGMRP